MEHEIPDYDILVWCLPGAQKARVVLVDEEGKTAARMVGLAELMALKDGVEVAIDRIVASMCEERGHKFVSPNPHSSSSFCARCGLDEYKFDRQLANALKWIETEARERSTAPGYEGLPTRMPPRVRHG